MTRLFLDPEEVEEGISAESESNSFEWYNLFRCNIPEVHIGPEQFDEPNLLGFLRSFPDDFFEGYLGEYFLYESGPHFST